MLILGPAIDIWGLRSKHFRNLAPVTSCYHGVKNNLLASMRPVFQAAQPSLVTHHCFVIGSDVCEKLAIENPNTTFVTVCHSSQAHLATSPQWMSNQARHLHLARDVPNFYYATPDERMQHSLAAPESKCLHWPNPIRDIGEHTTEWPKKPVAALIGRHDVIKNMPTQLLAVAIAGIKQVQLICRPHDSQKRSLIELCDAYGIDATFHWFEWEDHIANMASNVSVVMQASFSESCNYVALDSMLTGTPVIGSPAIRYLPKQWQANPDDADDISHILRTVLDDLPQSSQLALATGRLVASSQNYAYSRLSTKLAYS